MSYLSTHALAYAYSAGLVHFAGTFPAEIEVGLGVVW